MASGSPHQQSPQHPFTATDEMVFFFGISFYLIIDQLFYFLFFNL